MRRTSSRTSCQRNPGSRGSVARHAVLRSPRTTLGPVAGLSGARLWGEMERDISSTGTLSSPQRISSMAHVYWTSTTSLASGMDTKTNRPGWTCAEDDRDARNCVSCYSIRASAKNLGVPLNVRPLLPIISRGWSQIRCTLLAHMSGQCDLAFVAVCCTEQCIVCEQPCRGE